MSKDDERFNILDELSKNAQMREQLFKYIIDTQDQKKNNAEVNNFFNSSNDPTLFTLEVKNKVVCMTVTPFHQSKKNDKLSLDMPISSMLKVCKSACDAGKLDLSVDRKKIQQQKLGITDLIYDFDHTMTTGQTNNACYDFMERVLHLSKEDKWPALFEVLKEERPDLFAREEVANEWKKIIMKNIDDGYRVSIASFNDYPEIIKLYLEKTIQLPKEYIDKININAWMPDYPEESNKNRHIDQILGINPVAAGITKQDASPGERQEAYRNCILIDDSKKNVKAVNEVLAGHTIQMQTMLDYDRGEVAKTNVNRINKALPSLLVYEYHVLVDLIKKEVLHDVKKGPKFDALKGLSNYLVTMKDVTFNAREDLDKVKTSIIGHLEQIERVSREKRESTWYARQSKTESGAISILTMLRQEQMLASKPEVTKKPEPVKVHDAQEKEMGRKETTKNSYQEILKQGFSSFKEEDRASRTLFVNAYSELNDVAKRRVLDTQSDQDIERLIESLQHRGRSHTNDITFIKNYKTECSVDAKDESCPRRMTH